MTLTVQGERMVMRAMCPSDRGFIASTWGKSYRERSRILGAAFRDLHPRMVDGCLARGEARIVASEHSPGTIFAWASGEPGLLHYAYVIPELRGHGIARALILATTGAGKREAFVGLVPLRHRYAKSHGAAA